MSELCEVVNCCGVGFGEEDDEGCGVSDVGVFGEFCGVVGRPFGEGGGVGVVGLGDAVGEVVLADDFEFDPAGLLGGDG